MKKPKKNYSTVTTYCERCGAKNVYFASPNSIENYKTERPNEPLIIVCQNEDCRWIEKMGIYDFERIAMGLARIKTSW